MAGELTLRFDYSILGQQNAQVAKDITTGTGATLIPAGTAGPRAPAGTVPALQTLAATLYENNKITAEQLKAFNEVMQRVEAQGPGALTTEDLRKLLATGKLGAQALQVLLSNPPGAAPQARLNAPVVNAEGQLQLVNGQPVLQVTADRIPANAQPVLVNGQPALVDGKPVFALPTGEQVVVAGQASQTVSNGLVAVAVAPEQLPEHAQPMLGANGQPVMVDGKPVFTVNGRPVVLEGRLSQPPVTVNGEQAVEVSPEQVPEGAQPQMVDGRPVYTVNGRPVVIAQDQAPAGRPALADMPALQAALAALAEGKALPPGIARDLLALVESHPEMFSPELKDALQAALRARGGDFVQTQNAPAQLNSDVGTSLLTENLLDGQVNCLDQALTYAYGKPGYTLVFVPESAETNTNNAGHAILQTPEGKYIDPSMLGADGEPIQFESLEAWAQAKLEQTGGKYDIANAKTASADYVNSFMDGTFLQNLDPELLAKLTTSGIDFEAALEQAMEGVMAADPSLTREEAMARVESAFQALKDEGVFKQNPDGKFVLSPNAQSANLDIAQLPPEARAVLLSILAVADDSGQWDSLAEMMAVQMADMGGFGTQSTAVLGMAGPKLTELEGKLNSLRAALAGGDLSQTQMLEYQDTMQRMNQIFMWCQGCMQSEHEKNKGWAQTLGRI